jgi:ubiquinone/menaquinone biosynthesis C-methylase UbiE
LSGTPGFLEIQTGTAWGRTLAGFAAFCNPRPGCVILDVGCGPGLLPALFGRAGCQAYGVDIDRSLLVSPLAPALTQADAVHLPFPEASFDCLTATNLLFLLEEPVQALREWIRVLKPGGELCTLNPSERLSLAAAGELADARDLGGAARASLLGWAGNAEMHARWSEAETRFLFAEAGLELVESSLHVGPGFARFSRGRFAQPG